LSLPKILKLTNVLKHKCLLQEENFNFNIAIEQIKSYIKVKGTTQIGPLTQYINTYINDANELDVDIYMMLQCSNFIHSVELPYTM